MPTARPYGIGVPHWISTDSIVVCVPELHSFRSPSIFWAKKRLGPLASGTTFVVVIPFRLMISAQADSPEKVSVVNSSPTTLTSTGGLVTAVPNSPKRSTVRFSPFSLAGANKAQIGVCTFAFAVNQGSTIDLIYNGGSDSSELGYELIDQDGNVIFSTSGDTMYPPGSVFGLKPCGMDSSCGLIEVTFSDESGEGWIGGAFDVYSDEYGSYATIDFLDDVYFQSIYPFYLIKAYVPVNSGDLGFAVTSPQQYADLCGYIVRNPAGEVIVNQNLPLVAPETLENANYKAAVEVQTEEAQQDAPQAAASTPDLQPHQTILKDNQTGISYRALFADYLKGATSITLQDPYIRMPHQFRNLLEFCLMLANNKNPEDELALEVVTWNDEEHLPVSIQFLDEIQENLADLGIAMTYRMEQHHDRFIAADNGWKITLGRGLDIFEKYEGRFNVASLDQTKRKCKACEITYLRI